MTNSKKSSTSMPSSSLTSRFSNFVELTIERAHEKGDQALYVFLDGPDLKEKVMTFADLDIRARSIAAELISLGAQGERVLLIYECDLDYVAGFFGCLYAGAIAVPVYPPMANKHFSRLQAIIDDCQAKFGLTTAKIREAISSLPKSVVGEFSIELVASDTVSPLAFREWRMPRIEPDSIAFLQYTSGSTGVPKGVMVSHRNLCANSAMIKDVAGYSEDDVFLSWLPIYHDFGLIGGILQPVFVGLKCIFMPPMTVVRPFRWLQAVKKYRATTIGGPNFAFDLCVERITDEQRQTLDLSSIRSIVCGAEPIRYATLQRFAERFAAQGISLDKFNCSYGLAEATLCVTKGHYTDQTQVSYFDRNSLEKNLAVKVTNPDIDQYGDQASESESRVVPLVGCGRSVRGQELRIVDSSTRQTLPAYQVGEIWVAGPHVANGYWNRHQLNNEIFHNQIDTKEFLRTGDLGFLDENGELFVVGRVKDLIIIRGKNYCPQDIELACRMASPELNNSIGAAFSISTENGEALVVVHEISAKDLKVVSPEMLSRIEKACREAVLEQFSLVIQDFKFLEHGGVPRTSSGKIRRSASRDAYLNGSLRAYTGSLLQTALLSKLRRRVNRINTKTYLMLSISSKRLRSSLPFVSRGKEERS